MHSRPPVDAALVRSLVDTRFPRWAALPLTLLDPAGSDHVIYRLGAELSVRLPRLAPHLPLAIPVPVAVGKPGLGYPWQWAVSRWLDGEVASVDALACSAAAAVELAGFLAALQRFAPRDVPADLARAGLTGPPLADRGRATRAAVAQADGVFDAPAMTALWDAALAAPGWDRPPVWFHGDFHTGNLLTEGGRISAVIDFGRARRRRPGLPPGLPPHGRVHPDVGEEPSGLPGRARRGRRHLAAGPRPDAGDRPERVHLVRGHQPPDRRTDDSADHPGPRR